MLVDRVADMAVAEMPPHMGPTVTVVDPACGDGRLLVATAERLRSAGYEVCTIGVDIDPSVGHPAGVDDMVCADATTLDWGRLLNGRRVDVVVGNPPFRSPLPRGESNRDIPVRDSAVRADGRRAPYGDLALAFMELSMRLVHPGGRVVLVMPSSVLASRDAGPVRQQVEERASLTRWWWQPDRVFDAHVDVCVLGFDARPSPVTVSEEPNWSHVVSGRVGVPPLPQLATAGTLGDRCRVSANFRDEYYALVEAVDDSHGATPSVERPALVTSGLIDPWRCEWGQRPVRFAGRQLAAPVVDRGRLTGRFVGWAQRLLVPKVLVAAQTRRVEAVADVDGVWLPGVPVVSVIPHDGSPTVTEVAAVLSSSVATVWAWHRRAGTGLSSTAFRLSPSSAAEMPWPAGDVSAAVVAFTAGDIAEGRRLCDVAFGVGATDHEVFAEFMASLAPRRRT